MQWIFERMIELAAWVGFVLGLVFLFDAGYLAVQCVRTWMADQAIDKVLIETERSAAMFVLAALATGALACIDRYVFDLPEPPKAS